MKAHLLPLLLLLLILKILSFRPITAVDFVFNGFDSSNLLFYGNASIESKILSLTNDSSFSIGRVLYPSKIPTRSTNSSNLLPFSTSFIFSIARIKNVLPGHGLVFIFAPHTGIEGTSSAQHLGLFNRTNDGDPNNHVFGVEFDLFDNPEFRDINANHVGIDVNSLTSIFAQPAGYWPDQNDGSFQNLTLNDGVNYQVWVDYSGSHLSVTMAPAGVNRPRKVLINVTLDLSQVFSDEMYVGFCGATGRLVERHRILAWSFSNSNFSLSESLITSNLPSFVPPQDPVSRSKGFIAGITMGIIILTGGGIGITLFLIKRKRRKAREREAMEEWELEYWPHRINYQAIYEATKGFSEENVIGIGGNGKVYKGEMGGVEVAVKRFRHETEEGMKEFLAEVSSLGRLKHRNLVGLRGWCKKEKGSLILVYDYMENGSVDKRVFDCEESLVLSWEDRVRVLKDVAHGVLYLHEGWEARVLHRDIKASNVLLDKEMNGRLGDFGLARMHDHGEIASTTRVVGTVGYMAPEVIRTGRASAQTDVFGFGILVLEVVCGRRPVEDGKPLLIDWVLGFMERGESVCAVDKRLREKGSELDDEEVERILHLGLLCVYPDPSLRPTMRQVVKVLEPGIDMEESEDGFDMYLHEKLNSMSMSSYYRDGSSHGKHPTFEEISSSMSLSWSDIISDGR
ncbi:Protein kinase domain [Macleaya cordata]|uniref:non-specific serine/threonine protein kinase n=1 Tax=Macleaya cordata TaxID=56857 RepID=A0A200QWR0_MACCD|nr:Protein kinase domain [Macleaya cordata]